MTEFERDASDGPKGFRVGDSVRLREPHGPWIAGAKAQIIGFYRFEEPEAVLAFEDGKEVRVPCAKLERTV